MRLVIFICICILSHSCTSGESNRRAYVISQANETVAEVEVVTEPQED
jgi:hypothetical protein